MGLDMYLNKMPRYSGATAKDVSAVESYLNWLDAKEKGSEYAQGTFKDWCGLDKLPAQKYIDFYSNLYTVNEYGFGDIMEEVGYWRKANQIHNWFVENIQDGIDDCRYHREVTEEDLKELLDICHDVLCTPALAKDILPTQSGFFFGDTSYNEYYMDDIRETIDIITKVLETTDFDKEMIYYVSSW